MTDRKEFSSKVKVAAFKRATGRDGVIRCEKCGGEAKKPEVDHVNPDAMTGEPVLANAMVLCKLCHIVKTGKDVKDIAQAKRREARHIGAVRPKQTIKSPGFAKVGKRDRHPIEGLPPRALYR